MEYARYFRDVREELDYHAMLIALQRPRRGRPPAQPPALEVELEALAAAADKELLEVALTVTPRSIPPPPPGSLAVRMAWLPINKP